MFTGLIKATAKVIERTKNSFIIERPSSFTDLHTGSSISVSGACLTVSQLAADSLTFDVVSETWNRTTLGLLKAGDRVNLERALPANGRFEGHLVQGHIEGVGEVTQAPASGNQWQLAVALPVDLARVVVPKGSIAFDGVSLTVANVTAEQVTVALVPHTLKETTLGSLRVGDFMNVETDLIGRYLEKLLHSRS